MDNKIVEGPIEDLEWEDEIDWEKHLRNHRHDMEKIVEERENLIPKKEDKEKSWELYKLQGLSIEVLFLIPLLNFDKNNCRG